MFVFSVFSQNLFILSRSTSTHNFMVPRWMASCIHLRSSNVRHFVMVVATGLKLCLRGHIQWHDLSTEFHENLLISSKVDGGDIHSHRQKSDLISLLFPFRKEGRVKCTLIEWGWRVWTGFSWLSMGTYCGLLWTQLVSSGTEFPVLTERAMNFWRRTCSRQFDGTGNVSRLYLSFPRPF
jgi:hypothetical protein